MNLKASDLTGDDKRVPLKVSSKWQTFNQFDRTLFLAPVSRNRLSLGGGSELTTLEKEKSRLFLKTLQKFHLLI